MSSDPVNIGDPGAEPLWLGWYAGPRRADGKTPTRAALTREGQQVDVSLDELSRLVGTAGVLRWEPAPYGHAGWGDPA